MHDLRAKQIAPERLLETGYAHAVPVLHQALVVLEVEFPVLLELGRAVDRVGQLSVAHRDAHVLGLLGDQLLVLQGAEHLPAQVVTLRVIGGVLAAASARGLPEALCVGLREVARGDEVAVDRRRPGFRGAGPEAGRAPPEGKDEAGDDESKDDHDQRGPGVGPHHVEHVRKAPASARKRRESTVPWAARRLDTLGKPWR